MTALHVCAMLALFDLQPQRPAASADTPLPSSAIVVPAGESGTTLGVTGRILTKDGKPVPNARLYVYQTDARGYYSPEGRDERNPRLKAYLQTDDQGRYMLRTIKPGPYPSSGPPAHIHYEVTKQDGAIDRFELVFEGDERLTAAIKRDAAARGEYAICTPKADGNALRCEGADFYLK